MTFIDLFKNMLYLYLDFFQQFATTQIFPKQFNYLKYLNYTPTLTQLMFNIQQLFQMLNHPGTISSKSKHNKIVIAHDFLVQQSQFKQYSNEIKNIYQQIFVLPDDTEENRNKQINIQSKLLFQKRQTPMPICNKILSPNQPVFRCYDCMTHQASVLCKKCFQNANHKGHRYSQIFSGGGNCDCGNPDAIKPVGFCVEHPGKAEPVIVDEKQQKHFLDVIGVILEWIFRLHEKQKSKSSDLLGQYLADFLLMLNEKSLYYNTLTYSLLYSKRQYGIDEQSKQQKIIDKIFEYGVKLINFSRKITDVFLNMFSLQVFKYSLTLTFTQAFNKIEGFEKSKFKSLYIQLFANNDILEKVLDQAQAVLYPTKKNYDFDEYIENLVFLISIKQQVATKFFLILNEKGYVRFPELDLIQQEVQSNGEHIVSIINQNLNTQNYYYLLMEAIISFIQVKPQSLIKMLGYYIDIIMDDKYSYKKNKAVMPFHKILGMILLAIQKGQVFNIKAKQIQKFIDNKYSAKQIFLRIFKLIMQCFRQFSTTFFQTSYFDSYIPLYVKSGNMIVIFDLLMAKICIHVFQQISLQNQMNEILLSILQIKKPLDIEKYSALQQKKVSKTQQFTIGNGSNDMQDQQWVDDQEDAPKQKINQQQKDDTLKILKRNVQILKLLIEASISDRSQIVTSNSIKIKNQHLQFRTQQLFIEVMNNFKQISAQNLKNLNKNFIQAKNLQEDYIKKFLTFDKNKKKYTLNQIKDQNYSTYKAPLFLYSTMKKYGGIFAEQVKVPLQQLLENVKLSQQKVKQMKFLFNDNLINKVSQFFINELTTLNNLQNKDIIKVFLDFLQVIKILQCLMKDYVPKTIFSFYDRIAQLSQKVEFSFLSQNLMKNKSTQNKQKQKQSNKLKFEQKKKKKLEKIKKMQESYSQLLQQKNQQTQQNESICLICRQDNNQGLCFLSSFNYSNILQAFNKVGGRSLVFDSCFHPIHINCFIKASKQQYLPCPLCKSQSNVMLPFQKQFFNQKTIKDVYERIITLKVTFQDQYKGFDKQFEEFGILSIFRALSSMIGKNILRNEPILDQKDQRLANVLYNIVQTIVKVGFNEIHIENQQKGVKKFIQTLKKEIKKDKTLQTTNFYAVQYVILRIFHSCFIQRSSNCCEILDEPQTNLINKQDLRKLWQMCNQIVSLPLFKQTEPKYFIKQMNTIIDIYQPSENIVDLILVRDSLDMSCKNGHQMCICLICKIKCCCDCKQTKQHFMQVHCGEGLSFNLLTGGLVYVWQNKLVQIPSLYCNQMGFEWKPSKSAQGYFLDKDTYEQIKNSIMNESIMKFLVQRYPQVLKKNLFMDMNIF